MPRPAANNPPPRPLAALLLLAAVAGTSAAAAEKLPAAAEDPTVRAVLNRVESTYIRPDRIDPDRMLEGALTTVARRFEGTKEKTPDGFQVALPAASAAVPAAGAVDAGGLAVRLGPALEAALDVLAAGPGEDAPPRNDLRAALLDGALRTLDRYTSAYTGVRRGSLLARYEGVMTGIGARIGRRGDPLVVLEVYPDGGAAEAGLQAGDVLREIDDASVERMTVSEVIGLLRGEEGTTVIVEVERGETVWIPITRKRYTQPSVVELPRQDGIAAIRITHLSKRTPGQFAELLDPVALNPGIRGLVLDLRGNGGGSMLAAARIADQFITRGVLLETRGRDGGPVKGLASRVVASPRGWTALPVVVLTDGSTASSSELLTAALAWNDRALIVGQRTFGKNLIQKVYNYDDADLTVKMSSARFFSASRALPDDGIRPDVWIRGGDVESPAGMEFLVDPGEGDDPWLDRCRRLLLAHGSDRRSEMLRALRDAEPPAALADLRPQPGHPAALLRP